MFWAGVDFRRERRGRGTPIRPYIIGSFAEGMLLIYVSVSFPIYNADNAGSSLTRSIIYIPGQRSSVEFTLPLRLWNAQRKVEQLKENILKVDVSQVTPCRV